MFCVFCGLRNLPQQRFPSRNFTVLVLALRFIIHLIFIYYSGYGTTLLHFCIYVYLVVLTSFVENPLTSFVENHLKMNRPVSSLIGSLIVIYPFGNIILA